MKRQSRQQTMQRWKEYLALPKYKIDCWTRWFDVPTSLSCERLRRNIYVHASNKEAAAKYITDRFGDKYEILSVTPI